MAHQALGNIPSGKQMGRDTGFAVELAPFVEKAWSVDSGRSLGDEACVGGCATLFITWRFSESFSCEYAFISDEDIITFWAHLSAFSEDPMRSKK